MNLFGKNLDREVAVVAEIGVNHEGDVEKASTLLRLASQAGADAVKLQTYTPERYASASDPERLARVSRFALDEAAHRRLAREAAELGTSVFSSSLSEDVVGLLDELFPAHKIASGDLTFEPVIRSAARTGKPVILSTGLGTMEEIDSAIGWVRDEVGGEALRQRLLLMHCVSAYPTPIEQANVLSIPHLEDRTELRVGYSNHVIGPAACYAAVALGACMVEVHFTDRKTGRDFRDHELSFEPAELRQLVDVLSGIRASLGRRDKKPMACELPNLAAVRKGVVAARDLAGGTTLTTDDLMYARPANEFAAGELPSLLGRTLNANISKGELIRHADVEDEA